MIEKGRWGYDGSRDHCSRFGGEEVVLNCLEWFAISFLPYDLKIVALL